MVLEFAYLGSKLSCVREIIPEVNCCIARTSKLSGDTNTKRAVYKAVVVTILLYGAETWTLKAPDVRWPNSVHNHCVRTILCMTTFQ